MQHHSQLWRLAALASLIIIGASSTTHTKEADPAIRPKLGPKSTSIEKTVLLPALNNDEIKEMYAQEEIGFSGRFGHPRQLLIDKNTHGKWDDIKNGRVWRVRVSSGNALGMRIHFTRFWMPPNATLHFYNDKNGIIYGAYSSKNNHAKGEFLSPVITGDDVSIEYFEPIDAIYEGILTIGGIVHVYDTAPIEYSGGGVGAGVCNIDINCPLGGPWEAERDATAFILTYNSTCSGTLINNTSEDKRPYILTAGHCADAHPHLWEFHFGYEKDNCTDSTGMANHFFRQGAYQRARLNGGFGKALLLELEDTIGVGRRVAYSGWDRRIDALYSSTVGIHHPRGADMKMVFDHNPPATHWGKTWTIYTDTGLAEPGSSGSGLYSNEHLLIGDLEGPNTGFPDDPFAGHPVPACTPTGFQRGWLNYAQLMASWTGTGTDSTRLSNWLDPGGTGKVTVSSLSNYSFVIDDTLNNRKNDKRWGFYRTTEDVLINGTTIVNDTLIVVSGKPIRIEPGFRTTSNGILKVSAVNFGAGPPAAKRAMPDLALREQIAKQPGVGDFFTLSKASLSKDGVHLGFRLSQRSRVKVKVFNTNGQLLTQSSWAQEAGNWVRKIDLDSRITRPILLRVVVGDEANGRVRFAESLRLF